MVTLAFEKTSKIAPPKAGTGARGQGGDQCCKTQYWQVIVEERLCFIEFELFLQLYTSKINSLLLL